jgi:hypothetical protein
LSSVNFGFILWSYSIILSKVWRHTARLRGSGAASGGERVQFPIEALGGTANETMSLRQYLARAVSACARNEGSLIATLLETVMAQLQPREPT